MSTGTVIAYEDGYGLIRSDDTTSNIRIVPEELKKAGIETVTIGQKLSYIPYDEPGAPVAINIKLFD